MTAPIELDLDAIEAAAKAATPGAWERDGHQVCPVSDQNSSLASFSKRGDAEFVAKAQPSIVLELIRRLRAAEALAASRIETIPVETQVLAIFQELRAEQASEAEEFAEAIRARCGQQALVVFFQDGASFDALDEEQMRQAGWVRAEQRDDLLVALDAVMLHAGNKALAEGVDGPLDVELWPDAVEAFRKARAAVAKAKGVTPTT